VAAAACSTVSPCRGIIACVGYIRSVSDLSGGDGVGGCGAVALGRGGGRGATTSLPG
jgi:hypothetical protein